MNDREALDAAVDGLMADIATAALELSPESVKLQHELDRAAARITVRDAPPIIGEGFGLGGEI